MDTIETSEHKPLCTPGLLASLSLFRSQPPDQRSWSGKRVESVMAGPPAVWQPGYSLALTLVKSSNHCMSPCAALTVDQIGLPPRNIHFGLPPRNIHFSFNLFYFFAASFFFLFFLNCEEDDDDCRFPVRISSIHHILMKQKWGSLHNNCMKPQRGQSSIRLKSPWE